MARSGTQTARCIDWALAIVVFWVWMFLVPRGLSQIILPQLRAMLGGGLVVAFYVPVVGVFLGILAAGETLRPLVPVCGAVAFAQLGAIVILIASAFKGRMSLLTRGAITLLLSILLIPWLVAGLPPLVSSDIAASPEGQTAMQAAEAFGMMLPALLIVHLMMTVYFFWSSAFQRNSANEANEAEHQGERVAVRPKR